MVDVTHDGDHRRTRREIRLVAFVLAVGEVERLEQLAVLVLRADDLDDVVHLAAEQLQRLVVDRLSRRDHLAEVEQRLHECCGVRVDLVREVRQRRAAARRMVSPLPRGSRTPPTAGACMLSYSARFARFDLRPRRGAPPGRPNAPAAPPRPPGRPPPPPGRPRKPPGAPPPAPAPAGAPPGRRRRGSHRHRRGTTARSTGTTATGTTGAGRRRAARCGIAPGSGAEASSRGWGGDRPGREPDADHRAGGRTRRTGHAGRGAPPCGPGRGPPGRGAPEPAAARGARPEPTSTGCYRRAAAWGRGADRRAWGRPGPLTQPERPEPAPQEPAGRAWDPAWVPVPDAVRGGLGGRCARCGGSRRSGRRGGGRCRLGAGARGTRLGAEAPVAPGFADGRGDSPPSGFAFADGKDSRRRRATGASTVEDADFTNSPCSLSRASSSLLVTPSSFANSCTRALPATALLY